jgi:hypothetical protein
MVKALAWVAIAPNHAISRQVNHIDQYCASELTSFTGCDILRIACNAERIYTKLPRKRLQ